MYFTIIGRLTDVRTFAVGKGIREVDRLRRQYGRGTWRKRKGIAFIEILTGEVRRAEVHWHEATGIGRREFKIKTLSRIADQCAQASESWYSA